MYYLEKNMSYGGANASFAPPLKYAIGRRIVLMQNPRIVLPQIWSFLPYSFPELKKNLNIIFSINCLTLRNSFDHNYAFNIKKSINMTFNLDLLNRAFLILGEKFSNALIVFWFLDNIGKYKFHHT